MSDELENSNLTLDGMNESGKGASSAQRDGSSDYSPETRADLDAAGENSIVAKKRIKREELRRKVKRVAVIVLVVSLIVTLLAYILLLFDRSNDVRITASSPDDDSHISLSFDDTYWATYLDAEGPSEFWNVSYSPVYEQEKIDDKGYVRALLTGDDIPIGVDNGKNFIRFTCMLRNDSDTDVTVDYEMALDYDNNSGLKDAVRVMWGESIKAPDGDISDQLERTNVRVYAALSDDPRLACTKLNEGRSAEDGYLEYVAYPVGSDAPDFDWQNDFFKKLDSPYGMTTEDALANGFLEPTEPFGEDFVFKNTTTLARGGIMYCYVCIWLEGSDFDCVDSALGGYVKLGVNFFAHS